MVLAPRSTAEMLWPWPPPVSGCTISLSAACCAMESTYIASGLRAESGDVATLSSTFSVARPVAHERLVGVALDSVGTFARFHALQYLYRRRADVQPEQRRRLRLEQVEIHALFSFTYQPLGAIRRIRVKC